MPEGTENGQIQTGSDAVAATVVTPTEQQTQNMIGMALAFDDPNLIPKADDLATEVTENKQIQTGTDGAVAPITPTDSTVFEFKNLTEKYGWQTPEDATKEIEELRALKSTPPTQDIKYENEESKKLHQLIIAGKTEEAFKILELQKRIENLTTGDVTDDNAEDIIKLNMQLKYQGANLTQAEIDHKYKRQYALPKEPNIDDFEDEDQFKVKHDDWKETVNDIKTGKRIDAKEANIELQSVKTKLVLPNIESAVDPDYEAWKASNASVAEKIDNVLIPAVQALKESDVQLGFKIDDTTNQMKFDVVLVPTKDDFEKARQDSLNFNNFINKVAYDKSGKFMPQNVQKMILLFNNYDNYAQSIARQAVNEERKRVVAKETAGNNGNAGKDFNVNTEKTELQKNMEFALS